MHLKSLLSMNELNPNIPVQIGVKTADFLLIFEK